MKRRQILKMTTVLSLGLPLSTVLANVSLNADRKISFITIKDEIAAPALQQGDHILVDTGINHFMGDGVYLYPSWGEPRPYLITTDMAGVLSFFQPGKKNLLWTMKLSQKVDQPLFSGQVIDFIGQDSTQLTNQFGVEYRRLVVPKLPLN